MLKTFAVTALLLFGTNAWTQVTPPVATRLPTGTSQEFRPTGSHHSSLVMYPVYDPVTRNSLYCFVPLGYTLRIKAVDKKTSSGFIVEAYQDEKLIPLRCEEVTASDPGTEEEAQEAYYYGSGQFGPTLLITP